MTSAKQVAANRANALVSTGPRTPEGKAGSRFNALRHGLTAMHAVLPHEDGETFIDVHEALMEDLAPVGPVEEVLAQRVVSAVWRLQRAPTVEAEFHMERRKYPLTRHKVHEEWTSTAQTLGNLQRYESTIERGLYKALHELQRMQAVRKGEQVPPTLEVSVEG